MRTSYSRPFDVFTIPACAAAGRPMRGRSKMLVQVCGSMAEPQTRKRETAALSEAMVELGLSTGTIVTQNEDERMDVEAGTIRVVPAWRFLLELPESTQ